MPQGVGVQVPPSALVAFNNAPSSNGRTAAFGAVYCGSNPCGATHLSLKLQNDYTEVCTIRIFY